MVKRLVSEEVDFTAPVNNRIVLARSSYSGVYGVFSGIDARRAIVPPMGLAYIAAVIREGSFQGDSILRGSQARRRYEVLPIEDNEIYHEAPDAFAERILDQDPGVVGISSATPSFEEARQIARAIKRRNPDVILINGGPHVNSITDFVNDRPNDMSGRMTLVLKDIDPALLMAQEEALRQLVLPGEFDYAISKEGEYTTLHLLEVLNEHGKLTDVPNLIYQQWESGDCRPVKTADKAYVADSAGFLDCLPRQAYDLMLMNEYNHPIPGYGMQPMGAFQTARGCPQACSFCHVDFGKTIRFMSAERVLDEIEYLMDQHGVRWLTFYDDTYTWPDVKAKSQGRDPLERVKKISNGIVERGFRDAGLRHQVFMRANMVDVDAVHEIAEAGVHTISIGVESGDDLILRNIGKGANLDKIEAAMRRLATVSDSHGVEVRASFILALPGETTESVQSTFGVLGEGGLPMHRVNVNIATPLPGTRMYSQALLKDRIRFVEAVKPLTEPIPDWSAFRRHGNAIVEVLDENGDVAIEPEELIRLQKKAHEIFYCRSDVFSYHVRQLKDLAERRGEPRDDAYYYRPVFFAIRELFGIDRDDPRLKRVNNPDLTLTHELVQRWEEVINDPARDRSDKPFRVLAEMNDIFGYHGLDTTPKGQSDFQNPKMLKPEDTLGRLRDTPSDKRQDPLIVSQQGLE